MEEAGTLRTVAVMLTSECNLRCAYCFENAKGPGRMQWESLRAALDLALEHGQRRVKILFSGGEPLLEFGLIRSAVAYANRRLPSGRRVSFILITNGTLLDENRVEFLAKHSFDIQLSFDGVSAAQDLRGENTFVSLDEVLNRLLRCHTHFYNSNVQISMTVVPQTVPHIADSFQYFLGKGASRVSIAPSMTDSSIGKPDRTEQLERQFAEIYEMSLAHFHRTGKVPLSLFRPDKEEDFLGRTNNGAASEGRQNGSKHRTEDRGICAAGTGAILSVDVDGRVYPCATLTRSYQTLTSRVLQKTVEDTSLGSLTEQGFWERYLRFLRGARRLDIFVPRDKKYSSYRRCGDCPRLADCFVCPVSAGHLPGNDNCERVSDFTCAFNFTALKYREQFLDRSLSIARSFSAAVAEA